MDPVQPLAAQAVRDRVSAEPEFRELIPAHNSVLKLGEPQIARSKSGPSARTSAVLDSGDDATGRQFDSFHAAY